MQVVETTPVNVPIATHNVGFLAAGCLVDNLTSQYAYVPAASAWVPPASSRFPVPFGTTWSEVELTWPGAPAGQRIAPVQSTAETLTVTWVDDPALLGAGGAAVGQYGPPPSPQVLLGSYSAVSPGFSAVLNIPNGAHAVLLVLRSGAGSGNNVQVIGQQSSILYCSLTSHAGGAGQLQASLVATAVDTQVRVVSASASDKFDVVAVFDIASVNVQDFQTNLPVNVAKNLAYTASASSIDSALTAGSIHVVASVAAVLYSLYVDSDSVTTAGVLEVGDSSLSNVWGTFVITGSGNGRTVFTAPFGQLGNGGIGIKSLNFVGNLRGSAVWGAP